MRVGRGRLLRTSVGFKYFGAKKFRAMRKPPAAASAITGASHNNVRKKPPRSRGRLT